MKNPEAYSLELVNWDLFCTLTLPDNLLEAGEVRLRKVLFAWLRRVADFGGIHFNALLWAIRAEYGERGGRLHFHALLGGFPRRVKRFTGGSYSPTSIRGRFIMKNFWEQTTGAMSRVFAFNHALPGVGYLLKAGAGYEQMKFADVADSVWLSDSVRLVLDERLSDRRMRG